MEGEQEEICEKKCTKNTKCNKFLTPYTSPLIINSQDYNTVVNRLRAFFISKNFIENLVYPELK